MELIYPRDWEEVCICPEVILYEPRPYRSLRVDLFRVSDGVFTLVSQRNSLDLKSSKGFVRSLELRDIREPGLYAIVIFENRLEKPVGQIGLSVVENVEKIPLTPCLDTIETLYFIVKRSRFIANGIGKSGTTWLTRLLGTLPGGSVLDMAAAGLQGISQKEVEKIDFGQVYHGHLRYALELIEQIESFDVHNVHIYRDLRDVVVSEYFHKFQLEEGQHQTHLMSHSKDSLLNMDSIYKWSSTIYAASSVIDWMRSGDCTMLRYEDMLTYPEREFARIMDELGLPHHPNLTKHIIAVNSFERATKGRKRGSADPKSPFRNGTSGNWREHLSPETAAELVARHEEYFRVLKYVD